jgi:hypothetical protein
MNTEIRFPDSPAITAVMQTFKEQRWQMTRGEFKELCRALRVEADWAQGILEGYGLRTAAAERGRKSDADTLNFGAEHARH